MTWFKKEGQFIPPADRADELIMPILEKFSDELERRGLVGEDLRGEVERLEGEVEDLEKSNSNLINERDELDRENDKLTGRVSELEKFEEKINQIKSLAA